MQSMNKKFQLSFFFLTFKYPILEFSFFFNHLSHYLSFYVMFEGEILKAEMLFYFLMAIASNEYQLIYNVIYYILYVIYNSNKNDNASSCTLSLYFWFLQLITLLKGPQSRDHKET